MTIADARVRNINGEGTMKEVVLDVSFDTEDSGGKFNNRELLYLPVPYQWAEGDVPSLVGKKIRITEV